jgi:ribosomal protein L40E
MTPLIDLTPAWLFVAILVILFVAATSSSRRRKQLERQNWGVRVCGPCGTSQPPHAAYCRQCGQRI